MKIIKSTPLLLLILAFAPICFSQDARNIDEVMSQYAKFEQFNGVILVAEKDKIIYHKAFGTANFSDGSPNRIDTRFRIASISKQFTATLISQTIAEGKLNLDDKIGKYLPDFSHEIGNRITIRHLLTHSSGLPDFFRLKDWQKVMADPGSSMLDPVKLAYSAPVDFQPGEKYGYCNLNYLILGVILEKALNAEYEQTLGDRILKPQKLSNTGVSFDISKIPNHAFGYQKNRFFEYEPEGRTNARVAQAAGGLYSTTEDMFRFSRAVFNGDLLPPEFVRQMTSPQLNERDRSYPARSYAFGWHTDTVTIGSKSVNIIEHGGSINGFQGLLTYAPDREITIAFLVNTDYIFEFELRNRILEILHGGRVILPRQSYCQTLIKKIKKAGFVIAMKDLPPNDKKKFYTSENEINRLGYHYLRSNSPKEAIEVFKLNTKFFPNSPNVYNSLGEAYQAAKHLDRAKKYYQKAIDYAARKNDPDIETYRDSLKKLPGQ